MARAQRQARTHRGNATRRRRRFAPGLMAFAAFLIFGLSNTETSALPIYIMQLGGAPIVAGLQNSLFVLLAIIMRTPLEPLVARRGSRFALVLGACGYVVPCLLLAWCTSLEGVIALRVLQALGLAAFQPGVAQYLTAVSPPEKLGRRLGVVRFATTASLMVGPSVLFPCIDYAGYPVFFALLTMVGAVGLACAAALPSDKSMRPRSEGARENASTRIDASARGASPRADADAIMSASESKGTHAAQHNSMASRVLLMVGPFLFACGYSVTLNFSQTFARMQLPGFSDSVLLWCMGLGGLASCLVAGFASDKLGAKRAASGCLAFGGAGLLLIALGNNPAATLAGAALYGAGYFGATTTFVAAAGSSVEASRADAFLSRQQSSLDAGIIIGSALAGASLQAGLSLSIAFVSSAAALLVFIPFWGIMYPVGCVQSKRDT